MTRWHVFLALVAVLALAVVVLARSSARALEDLQSVSGRALRWNVVFSQSLVAVVVLAGAWATGVPWTAFGWSGLPAASTGTVERLLAGVGLGVAIASGNLALERVVDAGALREAAALRRKLAPETPVAWANLLLVTIPIIAISEELLFRGAMVGALAVGFDVSPWALAVVASLAFGAAHTAQGWLGIAVTATFGFVLAVAFVLTHDLVVVVVAHAVVDAVEFLHHEGPHAAR